MNIFYIVFPAYVILYHTFTFYFVIVVYLKRNWLCFSFLFRWSAKSYWLAFSWRTLSSGLHFNICNPRAKSQGIHVFFISMTEILLRLGYFYCLCLWFHCSIVKSEPKYAYKRYAYNKKNMYVNTHAGQFCSKLQDKL